VYLLFGLVPIFFLPFTAFPLEENKTVLASILTFVAFGAFLAKTLNSGKLTLPKTRFWFLVLAFLAIIAVSTGLSDSLKMSIWGDLASGDSLVNFLVFGLAMFLVPAFLRETKELINALLFFSAAIVIISVYSLLQFFGIFIFPFEFAKQVSFNPIGTTQSLAIFLGSGLVMLVALISSFKLSQAMKSVFAAGAAVLAAILVLVNFNYVWLGILIASALVVSWQVMTSRKSEGASLAPKFGLPMVLMVIVAILFFVQPPISQRVRLPAEVRPSLSSTIDIAKSSFSSDPKNAVLGSGPSTFVYEFLMHRSQDLNATSFWGVRFSQGFATIPTYLVTIGILGTASLLAMFGFFVWTGFKGVTELARKGKQQDAKAGKGGHAERIALISFVSFIFLLISWFYYPLSFSILLFTFLFAGTVLGALRSGGAISDLELSLLKTPQRTLLASLVTIILIVAVIVGVYWQGQKYVASVYHSEAVKAYNVNNNLDAAMQKVGVAVNLDGSRDLYWRTFTELLSVRAQQVLNSNEFEVTELQRRYQVVLQSLIQAGQQATAVNPADPLNWRALAAVYEQNINVVGGADGFAIQNYKKSAELNPMNPAEYLNIARAYVRSADNMRNILGRLVGSRDADQDQIDKLRRDITSHLDNALVYLDKSIALKSDYASAYFLSSQVYERQGNRELAIQRTLETRNLNPLDTGVGYQLGLLYYLDNQTTQARDEFERVVSLSSTFSNARYFLGLSYDLLGEKNKAITQFEEIEKFNPDNDEVKRILVNLQAGRPALSNIVPPAAPPEERIAPPVSDNGGAGSAESPSVEGQ
jgi:tetratricopeptide (TPR) repeat protein